MPRQSLSVLPSRSAMRPLLFSSIRMLSIASPSSCTACASEIFPSFCMAFVSLVLRFSARTRSRILFFSLVDFACASCTGVKYSAMISCASFLSFTMSRILRSIVSRE